MGKKQTIEIPREESCETCHGSGAKPGTDAKGLFALRRLWSIKCRTMTPFGKWVNRRVCNYRSGTENKSITKCSTCGGLVKCVSVRKSM
ncbi:hypothetical protein ACEQPO_19530 [Bacillus sp. SL00103]